MVFFRYAADPESPLSPFSDESGPAREWSTALYREAVEGAKDLKVPANLREQLPSPLWLYQTGVIRHWVHDRSQGSAQTYVLVDRTVPIVCGSSVWLATACCAGWSTTCSSWSRSSAASVGTPTCEELRRAPPGP